MKNQILHWRLPLLGLAVFAVALAGVLTTQNESPDAPVALTSNQLSQIVGADPWGCDLAPTWCISINYCTGCDDGSFFGACNDSGRVGNGSRQGCIPADNDWICIPDWFNCSRSYDCGPFDIPFVRCAFDCYFEDDFEDCPMCVLFGAPYDITWIQDDFCFPDIWTEEPDLDIDVIGT